jgi:hypothetical protein
MFFSYGNMTAIAAPSVNGDGAGPLQARPAGYLCSTLAHPPTIRPGITNYARGLLKSESILSLLHTRTNDGVEGPHIGLLSKLATTRENAHLKNMPVRSRGIS